MFTFARLALLIISVATALLAPAAVSGAATDKAGQPTDEVQLGKPSSGDKKGSKSIYGGYYPAADAWPWVTALQNRSGGSDFDQNGCTAVLVAPQRVLTAAHCVVGADQKTPRPASSFEVLVGRRDLRNTSQGERRNVTGVVVHPKVDLPQGGVRKYHAFYDIAVLFLDQPVAATPATIGAPTDWNSWGTVMGWGHSNLTADANARVFDPNLRAADFDLFSDAQCAARFNDAQAQHFYPAIHVCAGNPPNAATFDCITHGDSGGPLMALTTAGWRLLGITSFYASRNDPQCGSHPGPFGFAWVAGAEMRDWPLTVAHPPTQSYADPIVPVDPIDPGNSVDPGDPVDPVDPIESLDLSMTRTAALGYVRSMIRTHTNGSVKRLKRSCSQRTDASYRCRLSWRIGRSSYSGSVTVRHYEEDGEVYWTYTFKGKQRRPGRSARRLSW